MVVQSGLGAGSSATWLFRADAVEMTRHGAADTGSRARKINDLRGATLGALWAHSGRTLGALWAHSGRTPGALRAHSGRTPGALRAHSGQSNSRFTALSWPRPHHHLIERPA